MPKQLLEEDDNEKSTAVSLNYFPDDCRGENDPGQNESYLLGLDCFGELFAGEPRCRLDSYESVESESSISTCSPILLTEASVLQCSEDFVTSDLPFPDIMDSPVEDDVPVNLTQCDSLDNDSELIVTDSVIRQNIIFEDKTDESLFDTFSLEQQDDQILRNNLNNCDESEELKEAVDSITSNLNNNSDMKSCAVDGTRPDLKRIVVKVIRKSENINPKDKEIQSNNINSEYQQKSLLTVNLGTGKNAENRIIDDESDSGFEKCLNKSALQARINREKKKAYISGLEKEMKALKKERDEMVKKIDNLEEKQANLTDEVTYLKSILANDSMLANLISNINGANTVELSSSFGSSRKRNSDDDISDRSCKKPRSTASPSGVCLHVNKDSLSLEFCHHCAKSSGETPANNHLLMYFTRLWLQQLSDSVKCATRGEE